MRTRRRLLAGVGLQLLVVTPVALAQAVIWLKSPLVFPLSATVLVGGRSSVAIYESTVDAVHGDRRDTFMDAAGWYDSIAGAQVLAVPALLALVLINAALAFTWPWWGT